MSQFFVLEESKWIPIKIGGQLGKKSGTTKAYELLEMCRLHQNTRQFRINF